MRGLLVTIALVSVLAFAQRQQKKAAPSPPAEVAITTAQYDNARSGANANEKQLTPQNVNAKTFGKVFTFTVDGDVYAQPLYVPHLNINGKGTHNVLFVATEHDSVYAFDADGASTEPLWHSNFLETGKTTVPAQDTHCPFIRPEVGITSTPVIDRESDTIYVLARTKEQGSGVVARTFGSAQYVQKLHALDITTGAERQGSPVTIQAGVKTKNGELAFEGLKENPRAPLLLDHGKVYLTWGSSCDVGPYQGWVMAYDARSLKQTGVFNAAPDAGESGIWGSDTGPAADKDGNIFVVTGNGEFNADRGGHDYGDTVLKLAPGTLELRDYFTPSNQRRMNEVDADLGSGNPVLLPDQPGAHAHVLLVEGKDGKLRVVDRDAMGKFQPGDDPHAVQVMRFPADMYGAPAVWNQHVFTVGNEDVVKDFALKDGKLATRPVSQGTEKFGNPGATPAVSSNGSKDGIVWFVETKTWNGPDRRAILHAYDAGNLAHELWNSMQNAARDQAAMSTRFVVPTVANGRVYIGTKGAVDCYGLLK